MPKQIQLRRGTTAEHSTFAGADGEVTVDKTKRVIVVHDGATAGGFPMAPEGAVLVKTGSLVWVDAINGNDGTGVRGRVTLPFLTLNAAKAAASSGDCIMVLPGTYNERQLAKNGVNWYFFPGATVSYAGASNGGIWDSANAGMPCTFKVRGSGVFKVTSESTFSPLIYSYSSSDDFDIECEAIESLGACVSFQGKLVLTCRKWMKSTARNAILVNGASADVRIDCDYVWNAGQSAIAVSAGLLKLRARHVYCQGGLYGLEVTGGTALLDIQILQANQGHAIYYNGASAYVFLRNARVICDVPSSAGRAIRFNVAPSSPGKLALMNCFLFCYMDMGYSVTAAAASMLHNYGSVVANQGKDSNVTVVGPAIYADDSMT